MRQYGSACVRYLDIMTGLSIVLIGKIIITDDELYIMLFDVLSLLIRSCTGLIATGCGDDAIRIYREVSDI